MVYSSIDVLKYAYTAFLCRLQFQGSINMKFLLVTILLVAMAYNVSYIRYAKFIYNILEKVPIDVKKNIFNVNRV